MALSFQNQGIGTAKVGIGNLGYDKTFTMNGVNGELTNAAQFSTAIETLVDVVGWTVNYDSEDGYGNSLRRVTTQRVAGTKG